MRSVFRDIVAICPLCSAAIRQFSVFREDMSLECWSLADVGRRSQAYAVSGVLRAPHWGQLEGGSLSVYSLVPFVSFSSLWLPTGLNSAVGSLWLGRHELSQMWSAKLSPLSLVFTISVQNLAGSGLPVLGRAKNQPFKMGWRKGKIH